jgi:putative oxidoreductase
MSAFLRLVGPMPWHTDLGIAVFRVIVGVTFFMHGWQKVFQYGFPGVTNAFTQMGVPLPGLMGPLVAVVELVVGGLLLVGLFSRPAAIVLAVDMLIAILLVHLPGGFFLPNGVELVLLLFPGAVAVVLTGPGRFALDHLWFASRSGEAYGRPTGLPGTRRGTDVAA